MSAWCGWRPARSGRPANPPPDDIAPGLATLARGGREGILIVQSGLNLNIPGRSLEVATSHRIVVVEAPPM